MMRSPQLTGCTALIVSPEPRNDVFNVEVTAPDGRKLPIQVVLRQLYQQPPSAPPKMSKADLENLAKPIQDLPSRAAAFFINAHHIAIHIHDISWPSYVHGDPAAFRPVPDADGSVRYWGLVLKDKSARFTGSAGLCEIHSRQFFRHNYGELAMSAVDDPDYVRKPSDGIGLPEEQWILKLLHIHRARLLSQQPARDAVCAQIFTLRVSMDGVDPPVFRILRVPGGAALSTLVVKVHVLLPSMGWRRAYHDYCIMDERNGAMYGPKSSTAVDTAFRPMHGYLFVNDDSVRLGDLLDATGQRLHWIHDLGVRWQHTIEVVSMSSTPLPIGQSHVLCLDGAGACPPEDGAGCDFRHVQVRQMLRLPLPISGKCRLDTDTLWMEECGNQVYNRSIAAGGCLRDTHADYQAKQKEIIDARKDMGDASMEPFDFNLLNLTLRRYGAAMHMVQDIVMGMSMKN